MRALTAGELLEVWEAGFAQAPTERALALLAVACPETSPDALAALSIGQRDAQLLTLRQWLWGAQMPAVVVCPGCRDRLELSLDTREMLADSPAEPPGEISLSIDEYHMTFRLPTSRDLIATSGLANPEDCRNFILERCLISAEHCGYSTIPRELPLLVVTGLVEGMAQADPLADIQLDLSCPACRHQWRSVFDIVSYIWTELEVLAWKLLSDVHSLASAYGWSERDILSLSPTRRQFYLDRVGA
jgi:hypothetical protein